MNPLEEILNRITSRIDYLKGKLISEYEIEDDYSYVGKDFAELKTQVLLYHEIDVQNYCNEIISQIDKTLNEDPDSFLFEYHIFVDGQDETYYKTSLGGLTAYSFVQNELNDYKIRLQEILDLVGKKTLTVSTKKVNKIPLQATIAELAVLINLLKEIGFVDEKTSLKDMSNTFSEVFLRSDGTPIGKSTLVKECSSLDFSGYCKFGERYLDTIKEKYKELKSKTESKKNAATRPSPNRK